MPRCPIPRSRAYRAALATALIPALLCGVRAASATSPPLPGPEAQSSHPAAFWEGIIAADFALPEGASAGALLDELAALHRSPDPHWRDDIGYGIAARWLYSDLVDEAAKRRALRRWLAALNEPTTGTDGTIGRSFAALNLASLVSGDNQHPWLSADEVGQLVDAALQYLANEHDLRGYEEPIGWIHASAHTADLLKFLSRSRHLPIPAQSRILDAIAAKQAATGTTIFSFGEDERFARVVVALIRRADHSPVAYESFLRKLQTITRYEPGTRLDLARFAAAHNAERLMVMLHALLTLTPQPQPNEQAASRLLVSILRGE